MASKKKSGNLTGRYKKQHGLHHKHGNQYLKVYWPYIPVAIVVFGGIIASLVILSTRGNTTTSNSITQASLLTTTNQIRESDSLQPLQQNSDLATAAQIKANDMAMKDYWSPTSPSGQTPWGIIQTTGYKFSTAGENLAYGFSNSQTLQNAWDASASHKANIVNSSYTSVGFGIAEAPDYMGTGPQTIVVAFYAAPVGETASVNTNNGGVLPFTSASLVEPKSQTVARVETLTGNHSYLSVFIVGIVAGTALAIIVVRHGLVFRRWAFEGERLIIKHPIIDLCLVAVILGAASLNQTVGIIR